jgi:hypothetical protein
MVRIFITKAFDRWFRKTDLTDDALRNAVLEMTAGLIDADLGAGVFKKRVASTGRGKRSGARVLVASNLGDRWIFLFGFEKNKRANVSDQELKVLQVMGPTFLNWSTAELATALQEGHLKEINND